MSRTFRNLPACPAALLALDGNCGPLCVWMVLRYFGKRVSSARIIRACRHTKKYGTFTIALAVALKEFGLHVAFHSERDPDRRTIERQMYGRAQELGIPLNGPLTCAELGAMLCRGRIAIVYFDADERTGHFSPLTAIRNGRLVLPNTERGDMPIEEFEVKWRAPEICRQCVVVSRRDSG